MISDRDAILAAIVLLACVQTYGPEPRDARSMGDTKPFPSCSGTQTAVIERVEVGIEVFLGGRPLELLGCRESSSLIRQNPDPYPWHGAATGAVPRPAYRRLYRSRR